MLPSKPAAAAAVTRSASSSRANPKSLTFTSPAVDSRMLDGLMSRCTMPNWWTAANPAAAAAPTLATSTAARPFGPIRSASVPPSTNSITRYVSWAPGPVRCRASDLGLLSASAPNFAS